MILKSDGSTMAQSLTYCDGTDPTIRANRYCILPMTALRASPFLLSQGTVIKVTVEAMNVVGYSTPSTLNSVGADIRTEPL